MAAGLAVTLLSTLLSVMSTVQTQSCLVTVGAGLINRTLSTTQRDDVTFIVTDKYIISSDCTGYVVQSWTFVRSAATSCHSITAQIWRPVGQMNYMLVGENRIFDEVDCSTNSPRPFSTVNITVTQTEQIPVQLGDVIGWSELATVSLTDRMLTYDQALDGSGQYSQLFIITTADQCQTTVGATCSLTTARKTTRDYSIQAQLGPGPSLVFLNLPQTVNVNQLTPGLTQVYTVAAYNNFTSTVTVPPSLQYNVIDSGSGQCSGLFTINSITGVVSTTAILSAIAMCPLTITAVQGPMSTVSAVLTINISDVNQPHNITNLPAFIDLDTTTLTTTQSIYNVTVSDADGTLNHVYHLYVLEQYYMHLFDIKQSGEVWTSQSLSEWQSPLVFHLNITVSDNDTFVAGPNTLTVTLFNVRPVPSIANLPATVSISEEEPTNSTVYTLKPVTGDRSSDYQYVLVDSTPAVGLNTFYIQQSSNDGLVKTQTKLDYYNASRYLLEIVIQDSNLTISNKQNLTVIIGHSNESPVFTTKQYTTYITETQPAGGSLPNVVFIVTDYDWCCGDWYDYYTNNSLFLASNVTNQLYTTRPLPTLAAGVTSCRYDVIVTVYDSFGATDVTLVTVHVSDINDHSPTFSSQLYTGSVLDQGPAGSSTGVIVTVTDADSETNAAITLSVVEPDMRCYFEVNANGHVIIKQPIPYDIYPNVTLTILATDGGLPSLNATSCVFIDVNSTNSHNAVFNSSMYSVERRSDTNIGGVLTTVTADDTDPESVNSIIYSLVIPQTLFHINETSGDIVVANSLAAFITYQLYIQATDKTQISDFTTDPVSVSIDTYSASDQLVDIQLALPIVVVQPSINDFISLLTNYLFPWTTRLESLMSSNDKTIVRIYAVSLPNTLSVHTTSKQFIFRNDLLAKLRTDMYGTPNEALLTGEFAPYEVESVTATYPNWALETPEGIATLTISCVVAAALLVTAIVLIMRANKCCCFKPKQVEPSPAVAEVTTVEEFDLHYGHPDNNMNQKPPAYGGGTVPALLPSQRAALFVPNSATQQSHTATTEQL